MSRVAQALFSPERAGGGLNAAVIREGPTPLTRSSTMSPVEHMATPTHPILWLYRATHQRSRSSRARRSLDSRLEDGQPLLELPVLDDERHERPDHVAVHPGG